MPLISESSLRFFNGNIVSTHVPPSYEPIFSKFPMFIPMGAVPLVRFCMSPLVLKTDGDAVPGKCPQFFHEFVVKFLGPLALQEGFDRIAAGEELIPVAPLRVFCVGFRNNFRITCVPRVFRNLYLGMSCFFWVGQRGPDTSDEP